MTNCYYLLYNIPWLYKFIVKLNYFHRVRLVIDLPGGREYRMSEIRIKENESLDSALRRFKRQCAKSGVMAEVRKREHYEKPSVKRKKKSEAARKRKY